MQGWHAKKYANKVGMMHESKGQRIGKAPSLHLFHTTVRQCMKHAKSVLTVAVYACLWYNSDPDLE